MCCETLSWQISGMDITDISTTGKIKKRTEGVGAIARKIFEST
jgi:hypothetical protein